MADGASEETRLVNIRLRGQDADLKLLARQLYEDRRRRSEVFDNRIFGEPAWDMLLALYARDIGEGPGDVTWLAATAKVPQSTSVRWQWVLVEERLIEFGARTPVISDRPVQLTNKGRTLMEQYLLGCRSGGAASLRACNDRGS